MRVSHLTVDHKGRVTIFYEGADMMTDYCPLTCNVSQRYALNALAKDGALGGCHVQPNNYRDAGEPWPDASRKGKAFAQKAGLPFEDLVRFPRRATMEQATEDARKEPSIPITVCYLGMDWRDDNTRGETWQVKAI